MCGSCQVQMVLHILLVFCGAQIFGEGLKVINSTMSGYSGQYLLSATSQSNSVLGAAMQHFLRSANFIMPLKTRLRNNVQAPENFSPAQIFVFVACHQKKPTKHLVAILVDRKGA
jgi:hypothetical protein